MLMQHIPSSKSEVATDQRVGRVDEPVLIMGSKSN